MKVTIRVAVFAVLVWQTGILQADFVIDRLTAGSALFQFGAGTSTRSTVDAGILGGRRDESLTVRNQGGSEFFGVLGYNSNGMSVGQSVSDEIYGSLTWDNFSSIDFSAGGNDRFRLTFSSSDQNTDLADVVTVTVTSGASSASVSTAIPANAGLPRATLLDFSNFTGVDFTQVDSVTLAFDMAGFPGNDFGIRYFGVTAIPEPSAAWLGLLSISGWLMRRRTRLVA